VCIPVELVQVQEVNTDATAVTIAINKMALIVDFMFCVFCLFVRYGCDTPHSLFIVLLFCEVHL